MSLPALAAIPIKIHDSLDPTVSFIPNSSEAARDDQFGNPSPIPSEDFPFEFDFSSNTLSPTETSANSARDLDPSDARHNVPSKLEFSPTLLTPTETSANSVGDSYPSEARHNFPYFILPIGAVSILLLIVLCVLGEVLKRRCRERVARDIDSIIQAYAVADEEDPASSSPSRTNSLPTMMASDPKTPCSISHGNAASSTGHTRVPSLPS
ncbi:hypothetical protein BJ684DRAFT_17923, partial [Piptocephalis cylindrospora]